MLIASAKCAAVASYALTSAHAQLGQLEEEESATAASGHSRRFLSVQAASAYARKLTVKADVAGPAALGRPQHQFRKSQTLAGTREVV